MKINEVEALVGVTRRNIRSYEKEGLLAPARNSQNGYREYGEAGAETLGADAAINIRYGSSSVMQSSAEVIAYGTAVKFK